jgi:arginine utilization regulatory protein
LSNEFWQVDYVDSLMIIDRHFKILHTNRYNPRFDDEPYQNTSSDYLNKNFFEVYPQLSQDQSSMYECIQNGHVVYRENQMFKDYSGRVFNTCNLTIPINRRGEIVGAIELSKDITSIDDLHKKVSYSNNIKKTTAEAIAKDKITFEDILTSSTDMIENIRKAKFFSSSSNPTLIYGETGTGKELFVQAMTNHSKMLRDNFVALNCAAVPENLMESILFGAVKGAYTGAENRTGLFELADKGILFLDELNSMPYGLQAKLLRVLEDGVIRPVGANKGKQINVKIIAAMNVDPIEAIEKKVLREDLFYRFSSSTIKLVPLRQRKQDIVLYVNRFIKDYNSKYKKDVQGLSQTMMEIFMNYEWKGNVRELKHIIESMISTSEERVMTIKNLPIYMKDRIDRDDDKLLVAETIVYDPIIPLREALERTERDSIVKALPRTEGKLTNAAKLLCIPRQTLKYKMDKLDIRKQKFK